MPSSAKAHPAEAGAPAPDDGQPSDGVRIFTPENALSSVQGSLADPTMDALVRSATHRVERLQPILQAHTVHGVRAILELADCADSDLEARARRIGGRAREVCEVAAVAGMTAAGEAARGLYALAAAMDQGGDWRPDAFRVHLNALAVLAAPEAPTADGADRMVRALRALRLRLGVGA